MTKSKLDSAWEKLDLKYKILDRVIRDGHTTILAKTINEFREARLMTKFDHKSQLPKLFIDHNLTILPISRGEYVVGEFKTFHKFDIGNVDIDTVDFPTFLESLDYRNITSESTAINCAFVSKILHDFTEEENLFSTVTGRMSSSKFSFDITLSGADFRLDVKNSQLEIDGGYEGENSLVLLEAKNYISSDFLVRQLYYPFRLWSEKVTKRVRPIFLSYTNGVFHLREYGFQNKNSYNSLMLIKQKKYAMRDGSFNLEALSEIIDSTKTVREPEIPFPQADSFERVINLCELLTQKDFISKEEITQNYDFDGRQTDYYTNAGKYLGLVDVRRDQSTGEIGCFRTSKGKRIFNLNLFDRKKEFIKLILSHAAFKKTLRLHLENGVMPDDNTVVDIMKRSSLYRINSDTTYYRRASTIVGWTNWILDQIED